MLTGTNQRGFVIPKNILSQGASYIVTLIAKSANKTEGKVFRKLQTNKAPSGGYCTFAYKIGKLESIKLVSLIFYGLELICNCDILMFIFKKCMHVYEHEFVNVALSESVPLLSVNCSGWTDDDGDGKAMTYRYETVTKRQLNKGIIDVMSIHYDGSKLTF